MEHTHDVPIYALIPFILMLGSIAVLPLVAHKFWHQNKNKLIVSLGLGIPTVIWLLFSGMLIPLEHAILYDYVPFIILIGSLFVISGGIFVGGDIDADPKTNAIILIIGAILASFMGTTGAAMLLIRPLINTNSRRKHKVHIILFFIAIVANCGGLLTPLGDPPLFLMFLRGAPFFWFMKLMKEWAFVNILLIIVFYLVDMHFYKKESDDVKKFDKANATPIHILGKFNFLLLGTVVMALAFLNENTIPLLKAGTPWVFLRDAVLVILAVLSLKFTKQTIRAKNHFNWEPIGEVAFLFIGIFITMVPCLSYLEVHAGDLGIDSPMIFYYATGGLSGFLDNAPTAVTFHSLAKGMVEADPNFLAGIPLVAGIPEILLEAISISAVFFGAMTYIGNGPNFMVKAIAESSGIKMPDFFSYMFKFSIIVLLPIFILAELIFIG
jgi:Na+/H+ antiporter NhaD/arsenite permease-like protein